MNRRHVWMLMALATVLLVAACGNGSQKADDMMDALYKAKDYQRMLTVADSLQEASSLSATKANYWRGYAYDRLKQRDQAEHYWRASLEEGEKSNDPQDAIVYTKAASRLANLLSVRGDFEEALQMALPAAQRIETLKCDTTSDYINLLIYIGCCQAVTGQNVDEAHHGFYLAYQKHLENIQKHRSDASYKDAIAGLINIAYYSVKAGKYEDALTYTRNFGVLLGEYEHRPDASADYIDKQLGRYSIYKAKALKGLGRKQEADEAFETFQETEFSKTPEGLGFAKQYLEDGDAGS